MESRRLCLRAEMYKGLKQAIKVGYIFCISMGTWACSVRALLSVFIWLHRAGVHFHSLLTPKRNIRSTAGCWTEVTSVPSRRSRFPHLSSRNGQMASEKAQVQFSTFPCWAEVSFSDQNIESRVWMFWWRTTFPKAVAVRFIQRSNL